MYGFAPESCTCRPQCFAEILTAQECDMVTVASFDTYLHCTPKVYRNNEGWRHCIFI